MVPTQCLVGVTMQALYIGFAREKTYLTQVLEDALNTEDTGGSIEKPDETEQSSLSSLSKKIFKLISSAAGSGTYGPNNLLDQTSVETLLGGDRVDSMGISVVASDELKNLMKGVNRIESMSQSVTVTITYQGNSNSAITNLWKKGQKFVFTNSGDKWNVDDFGRDNPRDTMNVKLTLNNASPVDQSFLLKSGWDLDKTTTSKWDYEVKIKTFVTPSSGSGGFYAKQVIKGKKTNVNWSTTFLYSDILTLSVEK